MKWLFKVQHDQASGRPFNILDGARDFSFSVFLFLFFQKKKTASGTFCVSGIQQEIEISPLSSCFRTDKNRHSLIPGRQ